MLNAITDNLSRFEVLNIYIPSFIQLVTLIFWIFILKLSKAKYQVSIGLSLLLFLLFILAQLFMITFLARILAEYIFLFLGIGVFQMFISKES